MFIIAKQGTEAYNLEQYDKMMLLHGDTIAISRKGELYGIGKYDDAYSVFIELCEAMGRGEKLFKMP